MTTLGSSGSPAEAASPPGQAPSPGSHRPWWILSLVCVVLFMTTLDNLVVTTALHSIRIGLGASLAQLEWVVNAYTVSFAAFMLLGAALGDRYGYRRIFMVGIALFTGGSAAAAIAPNAAFLIGSRGVQGLGAAIVLPLSLTLIGAAFPGRNRGLALGIWSGVSGVGVALGPLVGGAVTQFAAWQYIFWLNVPVGLVALVIAVWILRPGSGPVQRLDVLGTALVTASLVTILVALVTAQHTPWGSPRVAGPLFGGVVLLVAFVAWERRTPDPMLPMGFFRHPRFTAINIANVTMYFGMFGAIFLLAPFLQTVQGYSPLEAGARTLPWTAMPLLVSPMAGIFCDRIGPRRLVGAGLFLQAVSLGWLALIATPQMTFLELLTPAVLGGVGMALVYPPAASVVLSSVRPEESGKASGAMNALREAGGAFGVAVLASVFTASGGRPTPTDYVQGLGPALFLGAAVLALGTVSARWLPGGTRTADGR